MMKVITDGNISIEFRRGVISEFTVILEAAQYRLETMSMYELFLSASPVLLAGKIVTASDERVEIAYDLPAYSQSVKEAVRKAEFFERVEIARKFSILRQDGGDAALFFLHPENLFLVSNQLQVAHRGLTGAVEPKASDFGQFFKQYKALVISTLNPRYKFEDVVTGNVKVRDKAFTAILSATTTSEIEQLLDEQYHALHTARKIWECSVKKSRYNMFKFSSFIFATLAIGIGIWLGLLLESTIPRQNRIIDAKGAYMVNNFNEATSILSGDDPRTLPPMVQYMLAVSYIELGILRQQQREAVINNLSPATHESELRYWIYTGRGRLTYALDIAYGLGDIPLKINAYGLLYDYVYLDMEMPGARKQEYLNHYRQRMEELYELLANEDLERLPVDYEYEGDDENGED